MEESSSTDDIDINAKGIDIDFDESGTDSSPIAGVSAKHSGSGNVSINISGKTNADMTTTPSTIDTTGSNSYGVYGRLEGTGGLTFTLENTEIGTQGESAVGMNGLHTGNGHLVVDLKTGVTINTEGVHAYGISVQQANVTAGEMNDASLTTQGTSITTKGNHAHGIWARRGPENTLGPVGTGDVRIIFKDSTVATGGNEAHGIYGYRYGTGSGSGDGHVDIRSENSTITTNGAEAYGILGWRQDTGNGDVIINLNGGSTTTNRYLGHGIYGIHYRVGTGNIKITTTNHAIWTKGTEHRPNRPNTTAYGIFAYQDNPGNIDIDLGQGSSVTTEGDNSHGIVAYSFSDADARRIDITLNGPVTVNGAAQAVRVGVVSNGAPARMAAIGDDGFRLQTVTVNDAITSAGEGIVLAGGGKVIIGPSGSIASGSGIAILATGTVPAVADDPDTLGINEAVPEITPKLRVDLHPDGQRMTGEGGWLAGALGGGWILNDGGETTIAVNGTVLHEGATGVVANAVAHNGVWDVTIRREGVTVDDRTNADPAMWTVSPRAPGVIADRDFNADDFTEVGNVCPEGQVGTPPNCTTPPPPMCPEGQVGTPPNCTTPPPPMCPEGQVGTPPNCTTPPPPMCPEGQVGTPPNCTTPPPPMCPEGQVGTPPNCTTPPPPMCPEGQVGTPPNCTTPPPPTCPEGQEGTYPDCTTPPPPPVFMEEYAPRAALYEALPDFLLGLHTIPSPPDLPVWVELSGHTGSRDFDHSTVDTRYDTEHLVVSAGVTVPVSSHWKIDASVHQVSGSADVSSPVKGGDIHARGQGLSFGARWHSEYDYYATGRVSWTDYDLDISSDNIGLLISNVEAARLALRVEAGRRMAWGERAHWTPQVRVDRTQVRVDRFTDAVGARASFPRAERYRASLGVLADTTKRGWGGELSLWGSAHLKHAFGDTSTTSLVSGERLRAKPRADSVQLGLGATWQRGPWALNVALSARQAPGGSHTYSGSLNVGMQF